MLQTIFSAESKSHAWSRALGTALSAHFSQTEAPEVRINAGQTVLQLGQPIQRLPLLVAGRLDCVMPLGDGETASVIPVSFGPGEVAMLSQLFCNTPVWVDLVAGEACVVRWLNLKQVEALLLQDPQWLLLLTRFLSQRLREVQTRERGWIERSVRSRVCALLIRLIQNAPTNAQGRKIIVTTHDALALRCGVSRPKVSQELKRLEKAGCLGLGRGQIEVLAPEQLLMV
jgi:CRP-like cAMP-binding protein